VVQHPAKLLRACVCELCPPARRSRHGPMPSRAQIRARPAGRRGERQQHPDGPCLAPRGSARSRITLLPHMGMGHMADAGQASRSSGARAPAVGPRNATRHGDGHARRRAARRVLDPRRVARTGHPTGEARGRSSLALLVREDTRGVGCLLVGRVSDRPGSSRLRPAPPGGCRFGSGASTAAGSDRRRLGLGPCRTDKNGGAPFTDRGTGLPRMVRSGALALLAQAPGQFYPPIGTDNEHLH
jgi:hypothetical protein